MRFDLISDLHLELWPKNIKDWRGLGTSLTCVVAGDVSKDVNITASFLKHLCDSYKHVIYVDGNHEHYRHYQDIIRHEVELERLLGAYQNLTYLGESSCMIDNTVFLGTNGWWTFDFPSEDSSNRLAAMEDFCDRENYPMRDAINIWTTAQDQASFMAEVVGSLQDNEDVQEIIMVTHTVPRPDIIPLTTKGTVCDWGKIGNSSMKDVLKYDYQGKISTWCFGHYHADYDIKLDGVRYVSHPRGRPDDSLSEVYYPKMIDTDTDVVTNH